MKKQKYYSLETNGNEANINIYGDITSWAWEELGEVSAVTLSQKLEALGDVSKINVFINSYGGEVAEGLAIYNALVRHKAKIVTHCDGFACSIASVIFMAGDERIMSESSLLMVHNAWTRGVGNAEELRKLADDVEKINAASIAAYKAHSNLTEEEIKVLLDGETWILPNEALSYGFATSIDNTASDKASQNARECFAKLVLNARAAQVTPPPPDPPAEPAPPAEPTAEPDPPAEPAPAESNTVQMLDGFFKAIQKM